jgi:NitT/TauT family transport system substrate-binding protein
MMMRRFFGFFTALLATVAVSSGAYSQDKIVIGYTSTSANTLAFVAQHKCFFAKQGLNVEIMAMRGGNVIVPSLIADSVQVGTLTAPNMLQAVDGGLDLVSLTGLSVLSKDVKESGVVARAGSNIKEPKDLAGKRIAVATIGSLSQVLFEKWLAIKQVDSKSIKYVEASFASMPDVIKAGNVDAVLISDPHMTMIVNAGTGYVLSYFFTELPEGTIMTHNTVARKWADSHPKEVKGIRAAIAEAEKFAAANPAETREIVGREMKLTPEVLAMTVIPKPEADVTSKDLKWWIDTMNEQNLLRTKLDPATLVAR